MSARPITFPPRLERLTLAVVILLLGACSVLGPRPAQRSVTPAEADQFELSGRINLRVADGAFPGRVLWRHDPALDELAFSSPIGTSVARMRQGPEGAWLITSDGEQHEAEDLRALAAEVLDWDLPIDALPYWVRGLEWPGAQAQVERDEEGRPRTLHQAGWTVSYLAWDGAGVRGLPWKLDVAGDRLRMRLVIERWNLDVGAGGQDAIAEQR